MTAKEKAKEIFNKMYQVNDIMGNYPMCFDTAKQCALIAVEEILSANLFNTDENEYWLQVKTEIENL